jgi:hypothetical protein
MSTIITKATLPIADGVGTVGVKVMDEDGVELIARSTAGVVLIADGSDYGVYMKKITVSDAELRVVCVWDDGAGNYAPETVLIPFTDSQVDALRALAVNTDDRSIDDLTTPRPITIDI